MQIPFNSKSFVRKTTISYYAIVSSSFNKEGKKTEYHWDILLLLIMLRKVMIMFYLVGNLRGQ